ncbi:TIGR04295 family B12-binding domain-containing radical SAM protein [Ectothiorhodospiraceae bacterium 2226]|nr:TIGR04295 family B12-binding domain-containing radical SAM protein [Ectothiorhodospiraceae bacterium 2226]
MKIALVNPNWSFTGSIYFGCQEPHLPLEYGYARALLEREGHEVELIDAHMEGLTRDALRGRVAAFAPEMTVVTTAPSYLFWRCAPPELRVPQETVQDLGALGGTWVAVGPHASTTPGPTLAKLGVDAVVLGECEEVLAELARTPRERWHQVNSLAYWRGERVHVQGGPAAANMGALPALHWPAAYVRRHAHHHHRFDVAPQGPGAELEASRGCPYSCTFCAKDNYRDRYRRRPLAVVLEELDGLIAQGVEYVYFVDEIFLPNRELLQALVRRPVTFGVQTRIDLWGLDMLDLLGEAGCVSIEAGVESISSAGRDLLAKRCKLDTADLTRRLVHAKCSVPFVQATLMESGVDDPQAVQAWREELQQAGVWANEPVPLFPYPGSPDYRRLWGAPDERAWERAVDHYLGLFDHFSDIQEQRPRPLTELEARPARHR